MANLSLQFRTFDQLLDEVLVDFRQIEEEGQIEPATLIKVAQRVNYDLGLRIHQTKEIILDVDNHTARLPEDFYTINFGMLTGNQRTITPIEWAGRTTEQCNTSCSGETCCLLPLTYDTNRLNPQGNYCNDPCLTGNPSNTCTPEWDPWFQRKCFSVCGDDNCVKVIEKRGHIINEYSWFEQLEIVGQHYKDPGSMNSSKVACHTAEIKNGFIYVHTKDCCKLYMSYQGALQDEQNNLLVLDHPEINTYYENALKEHIFRNLYFSANEQVEGKYNLLKQETKEARARALSIVNMPNFSEMKKVFEMNREAQYARYYKTFQTGVFNTWFKRLPY